MAATRDPFGSDAIQVAAGQLDPADLRDPEGSFLALQAGVAELQNVAHAEERLTLATRAVVLGAATAGFEYEAWGRRWRMDAFAELGLRLDLASERAAVAPLTERLGTEWRSWLVLTRASDKLLEGDFSTALHLADEARNVGGVGGLADFFHLVFASEVAAWTGAGAQDAADELAGIIEHLPFLARSWLAIAWLAAGERDRALDVRRAVRGHVEKMPEDASEWVIGAVSRVDLCEAFSDTVVAQVLYTALPFEGRQAIGAAHAPHHGPIAVALGRLALVLGRPTVPGRTSRPASPRRSSSSRPRTSAWPTRHLPPRTPRGPGRALSTRRQRGHSLNGWVPPTSPTGSPFSGGRQGSWTRG